MKGGERKEGEGKEVGGALRGVLAKMEGAQKVRRDGGPIKRRWGGKPLLRCS